MAGINLEINAGEIFGILGPNGAGKTTTLEMIEGLRIPDGGSIRVAGLDAVGQSDQVRRIIGVQLQTTALFDHLTAAELIDLFGGLYDVQVPKSHADDLLALVDLGEKRGARVNQLSGGQQQRLSIALALVNTPQIVFLDEPTTGLDPQARRNLWDVIRRIRDGGVTVVLTTHYMEEAEVLCDRVAVMDRGRVIACDTPLALIRDLDIAATVRARVASGQLSPADLAALPGVIARGGSLHPAGDPPPHQRCPGDAHALLALAARHDVTLANLASTQANLEDVFLSLTGRTYEEAETGKTGRRRSGRNTRPSRRRGRT